MKIVKLLINNFRGIRHCDLLFPAQVVLVGDNNSGKSTVLEAIDLVLGPERLSRKPIVDEHDFFIGQYLDKENNPINIEIEVVITGLNTEQESHFINHLEWWDVNACSILQGPPPEATDKDGVVPALRLGFKGYYDAEEDDFSGETFFSSPELEDGTHDRFGLRDKRLCGFLYLRTLRTGSRALSFERGSLLDIILKLRELKPRMWEEILSQLRDVSVANNPELGISDILESVQKAVRELVPVEYADAPAVRVSQMTREHLRQILTVFMGTGIRNENGKEYATPFHRQGTGTINTLVLSLLSMMAELKQNVIFAMEEPEIAIPPHTQRGVINSVISKSAQAIFTTHSPYVLEEFDPSQIIVIDRKNGALTGQPAQLPPAVKMKKYRDEVKRRFCEALLARRVLIVEGRTEYDMASRVARRLQELDSEKYASLESLGIAVISADTDSQIAQLGEYFKKLGKISYAIFDKQNSVEESSAIHDCIDYAYESLEKGLENLVLKGVNETILRKYAKEVSDEGLWPKHIDKIDPFTTSEQLLERLGKYFRHNKADSSVADCLCMCDLSEMPQYVLDTMEAIRDSVVPTAIPTPATDEATDDGIEEWD